MEELQKFEINEAISEGKTEIDLSENDLESLVPEIGNAVSVNTIYIQNPLSIFKFQFRDIPLAFLTGPKPINGQDLLEEITRQFWFTFVFLCDPKTDSHSLTH